MESITLAAWVGGSLIGTLIALHFIIVGQGAGCSLGYATMIDKVQKKKNLFGSIDPYKLFFMIGLPLGGLAHVLIFKQDFNLTFDMGDYDEFLYAASSELKIAVLFIGGLLLGFGARMAGGCTTGHALVGCALLRWSSILAALLFFAIATATTWLLFSFS